MIKVSIFYPNGPDAYFDEAYYRDHHMPMVKNRLGEHCKYYTIDKAVPDGSGTVNAPYIAMGHLYCESVEAFQTGLGLHAEEIMADISSYTNQAPIIQFSEVLVG